MNKSLLLALAALAALAATFTLFRDPSARLIAFTGVVCVVCVVVAAAELRLLTTTSAEVVATPGVIRDAGIGTVRTIDGVIEVENVFGETFLGRLQHRPGDPVASKLRPGVVVLVAFDPATPEELSLADDMVAVRAAFDQMLIRKGLITRSQLELIRHGTKSRGVVTRDASPPGQHVRTIARSNST